MPVTLTPGGQTVKLPVGTQWDAVTLSLENGVMGLCRDGSSMLFPGSARLREERTTGNDDDLWAHLTGRESERTGHESRFLFFVPSCLATLPKRRDKIRK
jgi:hypothetical protein